MTTSSQLGFPDIPKSVTNPNTLKNDALDVGGPMGFLSFIKIIKDSFSPESLQDYYNHYLRLWNIKNNSKESDEKKLIVDKYKDFLKEINLKYTSSAERKFLSNIDLNDPYDLDVALSFYSKKLREISSYYNDKREKIKYTIVKNKLKGTNYGYEKTIKDQVVSYLKTIDNTENIFNLNEIIGKLDIEIEELYNVYALYYNQVPDDTFDHKDLDYGYNIFLKSNTEIISDVFSNLSEESLNLKEIDSLLNNKRELTSKNLLTDFYYLSTGSTVSNFLSGKLFTGSNNSLNFSNRNYPTTVSKNRTDFLKNEKQLGFFKPSKISIVLVDGKENTFSINLENLTPNTVYYFPDPLILPESSDILTFILDTDFTKRNFSSGKSSNHPKTNSNDTKYYGYTSKIPPTEQKYLNSIFDKGFVSDTKYDIYGNLFGLFKSSQEFNKQVENIDASITYSKVLNGYKFFDDYFNEGLNFDYSIVDEYTFNETIRSGLSTNTANFTNSEFDLELNFGRFYPYLELKSPTDDNLIPDFNILEGAFISNYKNIAYSENISSDLSAFESDGGEYYYNLLIEAGLSNPTQRALNDILFPSISAKFVDYNRLSSFRTIDGGKLSIDSEKPIIFESLTYDYNNDSVGSPTIISSNEENLLSEGVIYVRNYFNGSVEKFTDMFSYLENKYSDTIYSELSSNIVNFDLIMDCLFIETKNYLIMERIKPINGKFDTSDEPAYVLTKENIYEKFSNRFKIKNNIFFVKSKFYESVASNSVSIYPEIYKFNISNFKYDKIFPQNQSLLESFGINQDIIKYTHVDTPRLTYSSVSDTFLVSMLIKDQNNAFDIIDYRFSITPDVEIVKNNIINSGIERFSNNLSNLSSLSVFLSGSDTSTTSEYLII